MVDINAAYNEAKYLPDEALRKELANNSGSIPGYILLSELQDRQSIRGSSVPPTKRGSMASEFQSFSKGGQIASINPFNAYINGLKFYKRLDRAPTSETQKDELGDPTMPPEAMIPPELGTLVPLAPGDPNNPVIKKYAGGGLASLPQGTRYAYEYYLRKGLPSTVAAGLAGNLHVESGGLSSDVISGKRRGDQGTAVGAAQWRGKRFDNLQSYAKETGRNWNDLHAQLDFPLEEMNVNSKYADQIAASNYNRLLASQTPGDAASLIMNKFERASPNPKLNHIQKRMDVANMLAGTPLSNVAAPMVSAAPGAGLTSPTLMGARTNLAQQTAAVAAQQAQQQAGAFAKSPGSGILGLMMLAAANKPQPPAPAPVASKASPFKRQVDPEEMTALTSHTPNAYMRRRNRG